MQAICEYRAGQGIVGPLYLGRDIHALLETACARALRYVDSKLSCPVYVAQDLSGSSLLRFQPRAEIISRTVGLGAAIGRSRDRAIGSFRRPDSAAVSINRPSAW